MAITFTDGKWSSTFDWVEQDQSTSGWPVNSDGVESGGGWTSSCADPKDESQITTPANNPSGGGGRGYRHWIGDGSNNHSGTLYIGLPSAQKELWIRWYFRFQQGFQWNYMTYHKMIYMHSATAADIPGTEWNYDAAIGYAVRQATGAEPRWLNQGWDTWMKNGGNADYPNPTKKSDGQWHWIEFHLKMGTGNYDGIAEYWYGDPDTGGIVKATPSFTDVNFGSGTVGWTWMEWPSNQSTPANGDCFYYDIDDIAIQTTGPIGPLGSPPLPSIKGLRITGGSHR